MADFNLTGAWGSTQATPSPIQKKPGWSDYAVDVVKGLGNVPSNFLNDFVSLGEDLTAWATGADEVNWFDVPNIFETTTGAGKFTEEAGSFALGIIAGDKGLSKLAKLNKLGKLGRIANAARAGKLGLKGRVAYGAAQGAVADFIHGDTEDGNLSNLIQEFPMLENPITDFLAHNGDDSEIMKRLKNTMEGIPLGIATDYLFAGLSKVLGKKRAKIDVDSDNDPLVRRSLAEKEAGVPEAPIDRERFFDTAIHEVEAEVDPKMFDINDILKPAEDMTKKTVPQEVLQSPSAMRELYSQAVAKGGDAPEHLIRFIENSMTSEESIKLLDYFGQTTPTVHRTMQEMTDEVNAALKEMGFTKKEIKQAFSENSKSLDQWVRDVQIQRVMLVNKADRLIKLAEKENLSDFDRMMILESFTEFAEYARIFKENRGNVGRMLKMFDTTVNPYGLKLKQAYGRAKDSELDKLVKDLKNSAQFDKFNAKAADRVIKFIREHKAELKAGKTISTVEKARSKGSKFLQSLIEWRITSMLSGITTHGVDRLGSMLNKTLHFFVERPIAALIGRAGNNSERIMMSDVVDGIKGSLEGNALFFRNVAKKLKNAKDEKGLLKAIMDYAEIAKTASLESSDRMAREGIHVKQLTYDNLAPAFENIPMGKWIAKLLGGYGKVARMMSYDVMTTGDAMSVTGTFLGEAKMEVNRFMRRYNITSQSFRNEMINDVMNFQKTGKVIDSATGRAKSNKFYLANVAELAQRADQVAQRLTYRQALDPESLVGHINAYLQRTDNPYPQLFRLLVFPFVKTPLNIIDNVLVHTPGLRHFSQEAKYIMKHGTQADKDMLNAKLVSGTMLYTLGMGLYVSGQLTGAHDKADRDHMIAAGIPEYSILIGNRFYSYNRIDPLGMYLGLIADIGKASKYLDKGEVEMGAASLIAALSQHVVNKTYMQGVGELVNLMNDPQRHLSRATSNLASSFLPLSGASTTANYFIAPEMKEMRDWTDKVWNRSFRKYTLPDRRDVFGYQQPVEPDPVQVLFGIRTTPRSESPAYNEMAKYRLFPKDKPGKIMGVELTPDEHIYYKDIMRELGVTEALDRFVGSSYYKSLTDRSKADNLKKMIDRYRGVARNLMLQRNPNQLRDRVREYRRLLAKMHLGSDFTELDHSLKAIRDFDKFTLTPDL